MRIGIFPGTFDPVHYGHINVLQAVAKAYCLQLVLIVPAGCTPNKGLINDSSPLSRWLLLSESFKDDMSALCCAYEINSMGCSYTADTIAAIKEKYSDDELFLVLGEDLYLSFNKWYRANEIRNTVELIVVKRDSEKTNKDSFFKKEEAIFLLGPVSNCSSTSIRNLCSAAEPINSFCNDSCEYLLYGFGLYLDKNLRREISFVKQHQKSTRFIHTIGVIKSALDLSGRLGIMDKLKVFRSALLHDIGKELPVEFLKELAICCSGDLGTTDIVPVLHAPAGAELADRLFSVPSDIRQAIKLHCTLDNEMTLLDKIIYISDMVEPSRKFPSVYKLRERFYSVSSENELNRLLILALEQNICYISSTGGAVHPASMRALNFLKSETDKELLC